MSAYLKKTFEANLMSRTLTGWKQASANLKELKNLEDCGEEVGKTLEQVLKHVLAYTFSTANKSAVNQFVKSPKPFTQSQNAYIQSQNAYIQSQGHVSPSHGQPVTGPVSPSHGQPVSPSHRQPVHAWVSSTRVVSHHSPTRLSPTRFSPTQTHRPPALSTTTRLSPREGPTAQSTTTRLSPREGSRQPSSLSPIRLSPRQVYRAPMYPPRLSPTDRVCSPIRGSVSPIRGSASRLSPARVAVAPGAPSVSPAIPSVVSRAPFLNSKVSSQNQVSSQRTQLPNVIDFQVNLVSAVESFRGLVDQVLVDTQRVTHLQNDLLKIFGAWRMSTYQSKIDTLMAEGRVMASAALQQQAKSNEFVVLKMMMGKTSEDISFYFQKWREFTKIMKVESVANNYKRISDKYDHFCIKLDSRTKAQNESGIKADTFGAWKSVLTDRKSEENFLLEVQKQQKVFEQVQKFARTCVLFSSSNPRALLSLAFSSWHRLANCNRQARELQRVHEEWKRRSIRKTETMMSAQKEETTLLALCFYDWKLHTKTETLEIEKRRATVSTETSMNKLMQSRVNRVSQRADHFLATVDSEFKDTQNFFAVNRCFQVWKAWCRELVIGKRQSEKMWRRAVKSFEILHNQSKEFLLSETFQAWKSLLENKREQEDRDRAARASREVEDRINLLKRDKALTKLRMSFGPMLGSNRSVMLACTFGLWQEAVVKQKAEELIASKNFALAEAHQNSAIQRLRSVFCPTPDWLLRECLESIKLQEHLSESAIQKLRTAFAQDPRSIKRIFLQGWNKILMTLKLERQLENHACLLKKKEEEVGHYLSAIGRKFIEQDSLTTLQNVLTEWRIHALHHCKKERQVEELQKRIVRMGGEKNNQIEKLRLQFGNQDSKVLKKSSFQFWRDYSRERRWNRHLENFRMAWNNQKKHFSGVCDNLAVYMTRKKHGMILSQKILRIWYASIQILRKQRRNRLMGAHLGLRMVEHGDHTDKGRYFGIWKQYFHEVKRLCATGKNQYLTAICQEREKHNFLINKTWDAWKHSCMRKKQMLKTFNRYVDRADTFHRVQFWFQLWVRVVVQSGIAAHRGKNLRYTSAFQRIGIAFAMSHESTGLRKMLTGWHSESQRKKYLRAGLQHLLHKSKFKTAARLFQQWKFLLLKHAVSEIQFRHHVDRAELATVCFGLVERRSDQNLVEKAFQSWFSVSRHGQIEKHTTGMREVLVERHHRVSQNWLSDSYLLEVFHSWAWLSRRRKHAAKQTESFHKAEMVLGVLMKKTQTQYFFHLWHKMASRIGVRNERNLALAGELLKKQTQLLKKTILHSWRSSILHSYVKRNYGYGVLKHSEAAKNDLRIGFSNWVTLTKLNSRYRRLTSKFDNMVGRMEKHIDTSQYSHAMKPVVRAWYFVAERKRMLREYHYVRQRQTLCAYFSMWHGSARQEAARLSLQKMQGTFQFRVNNRHSSAALSAKSHSTRIKDRFGPDRSPSPRLRGRLLSPHQRIYYPDSEDSS